MKKTKIVGTIGPASNSVETLKELFKSGLNVCRINFSHGEHKDHKVTIANIKEAREELNLPIAIMLDTKGPEIRIGTFITDGVNLEPGDLFTLTSREVDGNEEIVHVAYDSLSEDVEVGNMILIDDGLVELEVVEIDGKDVVCKALNYGRLTDRKGVNIPDVKVNLPAITEKDRKDIIFGIENDIDFIAASFIRKPEDVTEIRKILEENGGSDIDIIAKIENREGVDNIDEILKVVDGLMVARGDLGVEIETEAMPLVQKELIRKCNEQGKAVITATQMLDSMIRNPRPTRAEVTDVANAILDGTSAIMLSGETAMGAYPVESVVTMRKIAKKTENSIRYRDILKERANTTEHSTTNAIGRATCYTARDLDANAIIAATSSGYTAKAISKFRPKVPIIAATTSEKTRRKMSLEWGVYPVLNAESTDTDEVLENAINASKKSGYINEGDLVVLTAGIPVGLSGSTNMMKVQVIGKVLSKGTGIGDKSATGKVCIAKDANDLINKFEDGDIIVAVGTDKEMVEYMKRSSGIVTEHSGLTSHAAIVGLNLNKATIVGVKDMLDIVKDGDIITIDSGTGQIYKGETSVK